MTGGDIAKAIGCGADAVMLGEPLAQSAEAPGAGWYWDPTVAHPKLPRSWLHRSRDRSTRTGRATAAGAVRGAARPDRGRVRPAQPLRRPAPGDGEVRLLELKEFQKVELTVAG